MYFNILYGIVYCSYNSFEIWSLKFSSSIGVILRDSNGVAQVRFVTGNKILRILKAKGLATDIPEDLYYLIKKAVAIRKHLERNRKVSLKTQSTIPFLLTFFTQVCCTKSVSHS